MKCVAWSDFVKTS